MTQELALNWDGVDIEFSDSTVTRMLYGAPIFGGLAASYQSLEFPGYGVVEVGPPKLESRPFSFVVSVEPKHATASQARGQAFDHLREVLAPLLSPEKRRVKATWGRPNGAGGTTESYLWARTLHDPGWQYTTTGGDGAYGMRPGGRMRVGVEAVATYPYFVESTPTIDSSLVVGSLLAITNPGYRWVGWRMDVSSSTLDGSELKLEAQETGLTATVVWPGPVQAGTVVEFWYPGAELGHPYGAYTWILSSGVWTPGVATIQPGSDLILTPGFDDEILLTSPDSTTGTAMVGIRINAVYGTP